VAWWLIPLLATLAAWVWTRVGGTGRGRLRPRPEPGSPQDARDLARFADALGKPMPGTRP
jgi:hypothetical protein